jgi:hypothetical protein
VFEVAASLALALRSRVASPAMLQASFTWKMAKSRRWHQIGLRSFPPKGLPWKDPHKVDLSTLRLTWNAPNGPKLGSTSPSYSHDLGMNSRLTNTFLVATPSPLFKHLGSQVVNFARQGIMLSPARPSLCFTLPRHG